MGMSVLSRSSRPGSGMHLDLAEALRDGENPLFALLDSLDTNVFVADTSLRMIWMNRRSRDTLRTLEPVIRATFRMGVDEMLGGSIHRFHRDSSRIDRILADPSALPRAADFSFGTATIRTRINAITDSRRQRLGYVVNWEDISRRTADYREFENAMSKLSEVADAISEGTESSTARASSVAAATEELRASVSEIARSSTEATVQVRHAVEATTAGVQTLRDLQRSSAEIGDFLRLITGVAEQTKMLALNATIEAARAGEAGKGFAVVADEVKQLAGTTSASITDIESRIEAIQRAADAGVNALSEIEKLVERIREAQDTVAAAIEEQSAVASEIAQSTSVIVEDAERTSGGSDRIREAVRDVTTRTKGLTQA